MSVKNRKTCKTGHIFIQWYEYSGQQQIVSVDVICYSIVNQIEMLCTTVLQFLLLGSLLFISLHIWLSLFHNQPMHLIGMHSIYQFPFCQLGMYNTLLLQPKQVSSEFGLFSWPSTPAAAGPPEIHCIGLPPVQVRLLSQLPHNCLVDSVHSELFYDGHCECDHAGIYYSRTPLLQWCSTGPASYRSNNISPAQH